MTTSSAHSATSADGHTPTSVTLDLFAGPGGWSQGAKALGIRDLGLEWDFAACLTRKAAGHLTICADVAAYPVEPFVGRLHGEIGSPPCTLFSSAGTGVGNLVIATLARGITDMLRGSDTREQVREDIYPVTLAHAEAKNAKRPTEKRWTQERVEEKARSDAYTAALVIEPARFAAACAPEWIALEQVPEVLPLWQTYARELRRLGYRTWAGILNAADYGVAQTRERAFLVASAVAAVEPPAPTHSREPHADLFGGDRLPWVSMADALGWGMSSRPSVTLTAGGSRQGGPDPLDGGSGARETLRRERREGRWVEFVSAGVTGEGRPKDPETQPADTLTGKGTAYWVVRTGANSMKHSRKGSRAGEGGVVPYERPITEPAPTLDSKVGSAWKVEPGQEWVLERPATTVVGSFCPDIIAAPGYRTSTSRQDAEGSVRVTAAEASVLQSFPADYPWQGNKSKVFEQIGNAVPPLLAAHVLSAVTGLPLSSSVGDAA